MGDLASSWPAGEGELAARIRGTDWTHTALGPTELWPRSLKAIVDMLLANGFAMVVLWGPDLLQIYNDDYRVIMGVKHPLGLGQPTRTCWPEVWDINEPIYRRVWAGETLTFEDALYPITRSGRLEDAWFTLTYSPVRDDDAKIAGVLVTVFETTGRVQAERALNLNYRGLFDAIDQGYLLADVLLDDAGHAIDMAYVDANPAAIAMVGVDLRGRRLREVDAAYEDYWDEIWGRVAQTGRTERLERFAGPEGRWYDFHVFKPDASDTASRRVAVLFQDITERKTAETALRDSESLRRIALACGSMGSWRWDRAADLIRGDDQFMALWGLSHADEALPLATFAARMTADGATEMADVVSRALLANEEFSGPLQIANGPTAGHWVQWQGRAAADDPAVLYGVSFDITERRAAEVALRRSEEQQRLTLELVPALLWWSDATGEEVVLNERWSAYTGQSVSETQSFGWLDAIHPDDLEATSLAFRHAFATGEPLERHYRIRKAGNGYRWHLLRHVPVRGETGAIMRWFGAAVDVNELHGLQERQRVLLFELQHRVRNTLAMVRALARSTAETSDTVEDFAAHFEGRLNALARTQTVLTRSPSSGVDLESMVREELLAQAPNMDQIDVGGPDVRLSAKAAEVLALAVHELATNAVKYGALASLGGSVAVRWEMATEEDETWLKLRWKESGVRVIARAPRREGFGTELVTQRVPYELRGRGSLDLRPGGMRAEIAFPMRPGESILQTNAPGV